MQQSNTGAVSLERSPDEKRDSDQYEFPNHELLLFSANSARICIFNGTGIHCREKTEDLLSSSGWTEKRKIPSPFQNGFSNRPARYKLRI
jgi:hypothetical protein